LNSPRDARPGSPWWRAVNEKLLRDTAEARAFAFGRGGEPSSPEVGTHLQLIRQPTARNWYCAHNISIVAAYLANEELAREEARVERLLGDPRLGFTGIFLSLSRVLPDSYPLGDDVETYIALEHGFGQLLDIGVIQPRLRHIYDWSADELVQPGLRIVPVQNPR
jgi:hypothetical protein